MGQSIRLTVLVIRMIDNGENETTKKQMRVLVVNSIF